MNFTKCECGAVTVEDDNQSWSMSQSDFNTHFPDSEPDLTVFSCNYCVNHWGIDLCACGSGENYQSCDGGFLECGTPSQTLG